MKNTRKTKNRYQMNILAYKERLAKCNSLLVKEKLKSRIHVFRTMINRIEKREKRIKNIDKIFTEYFDLDVSMKEVLSYRKRGELLKVRSLFFYKLNKECIDSTSIRFYYRLNVDRNKLRYIKAHDIKRVKSKYMDDWNRLRMYIKLKNEVESNA